MAPLMQPQLLAWALVRQGLGARRRPGLCAVVASATWVSVEWAVPKVLGA